MENLNICFGEIINDEKEVNIPSKYSAAVFKKSRIWKDLKELTIKFLDTDVNKRLPRKYTLETLKPDNDILESVILKNNLTDQDCVKLVVINRIQLLVPFKITFVTDKDYALIRINFDENKGTWSIIGNENRIYKYSNFETMNFSEMSALVIIHEFGHVLGMVHEHQSSFNNPIEWNKELLYKEAFKSRGWTPEQVDFNIIDRYYRNELNGSEYDPYSIMLYYFSPEFTLDNKGTNENKTLSKTDIEWILKTYPGKNVNIDKFYENMFSKFKIIKLPTIEKSNYLKYYFFILGIILVIISIIVKYFLNNSFKSHKD